MFVYLLYNGMKHGDQLIDISDYSSVLLVDFALPEDQMRTLISVCDKVVVLDHHISTYNMLSKLADEYNNFEYVYDVNKAGCQITWEYFHDIPIPDFLNYIADRDLWTWKLDNSKEINNAIFNLYKRTFEDFYILMNVDLKYLTDVGSILINHDNKTIDYLAYLAVKCTFDNKYTVMVAESSILRSELGNKLANMDTIDFSIVWRYDFNSNEYWLSLRVGDNSDTDVSKIASKFGGGGHKKASGITLKDIKSIIVPIKNE